MNIFVVNLSPIEAARSLCNAHVVKMTLESAQILSTVLHSHGLQCPYKPTHRHHPCVKWAAESRGNYSWLFQHFSALLEEYSYRWGKHHACGRFLSVLEAPLLGEETSMTPFVQCMPQEYKDPDPIKAYRAYYLGEKMGFSKWTRREPPTWVRQPLSSSLATGR